MIDLKKIEDRFKSLFEQENENSFNEWLEDKKLKEAMSSLWDNENLILQKFLPVVSQVTQSTSNIIKGIGVNLVKNTECKEYALAA